MKKETVISSGNPIVDSIGRMFDEIKDVNVIPKSWLTITV